MTLSYDFLHGHAIGRTSNEGARATMRWIVRAQHIITTQTITVSNKEAFLRLSKGSNSTMFVLSKTGRTSILVPRSLGLWRNKGLSKDKNPAILSNNQTTGYIY